MNVVSALRRDGDDRQTLDECVLDAFDVELVVRVIVVEQLCPEEPIGRA